MLTRKAWDIDSIVLQLRRMARECSNPCNDGYVASGIKQDLLQVKFMLDDLIEDCPTFQTDEEIYHKRMISKLG
jgi:hypothetical protein